MLNEDEEAKMDKEGKFTLKLNGDGIAIERDVTPQVAQAIVGLILGGGPAPSQVAQTATQAMGASAATNPLLSVRECFAQYKAARIPEQIACIALYLKKQHNATLFTKKELIKAFEDAQEPVPANLARDIAWTTKNGWIAPKAGMKNSFYLTATGESAVTSQFPAEVKKKTKQALRPRKKKSDTGTKV